MKGEYNNLGEFLDKCSDSTIIDVDFTTPEGIQRVPVPLGSRPTVAELRDNAYIRERQIGSAERYTDLLLPHMTGWSVSIFEPFNQQAYAASASR